MNGPVVVANFRDFDATSDDYIKSDSFLHLERFFPKRASNKEQLNERISEVVGDYDKFLDRCAEFVKFHLEHTTDSNQIVANVINQIHTDRINFESTTVSETLHGLNE